MSNIRLCLALGVISSSLALSGQPSARLDSIVRFDFFNGDSSRSQKTIFLYDQQHRLVEEVVQSWSNIRDRWENFERTTTGYNQNQPDTVTQWTHVVNLWVPESRNIVRKDGKQSCLLSQTYDTVPGQWINQDRVCEHITPTGQAILHNSWSTDLSRWVPSDSTSIILDSMGRRMIDTTYGWVPFINIYTVVGLVDYVYDSVGLLSTTTRADYDQESQSFVPTSRDSFAYDGDGFQILSQFDIWQRNLQRWSTSLVVERTSDEDGLLHESRIFFANFISGALEPTSRLVTTYVNDEMISEQEPFIFSVKNFTYQLGIEVPDWINLYHYSSPITSSPSQISSALLTLFPNPVVDQVFISSPEEELYFKWFSTSGQLITLGKVSGSKIAVPKFFAQPMALLTIYNNSHQLLHTEIMVLEQ